MSKCCIKTPLETLGGIYGPGGFYLTGFRLVKQFSFLPFSLSLSLLPSQIPPSLPPFLPFIPYFFQFPTWPHISRCHLYHWKGKYYQVSVNICFSLLSPASGSLGGRSLILSQVNSEDSLSPGLLL